MAECSPCKGCENRTQGCHDNCDNYQDWKSKRDAVRAKMREERDIKVAIDQIISSRFTSRNRKKYR